MEYQCNGHTSENCRSRVSANVNIANNGLLDEHTNKDSDKFFVALGKDLCEKLQKVWFTEEEYERHKDSPATLRSVWSERWDQAMKK